MTEYIRRLVSGNKARFKDGELNLELDLVYIADQVIIMGYPAAGIEAWYRNRREDAKRFLEHRHGKDFWVFNFCPTRENSYPASLFEGRVSRYPFPDHHVPPLTFMPLVAREMRVWLSGSPERVAVLHCKAGKGRSGTMACSYLLSLDDDPSPPRQVVSEDNVEDNRSEQPFSSEAPPALPLGHVDHLKGTETPVAQNSSPTSSRSSTTSLKGILDLHTTRRMKAPSSPGKKAKQGISIPSQRRWLYYWALSLAHEAPAHLWTVPTPSQLNVKEMTMPKNPKVLLTQIVLRMKETSAMKKNLVRAASLVINRTGRAKNVTTNGKETKNGHVWVSLARYDDELVDLLERWEVHTRDGMKGHAKMGHLGKRREGSDRMGTETINQLFEGRKWDNKKMVGNFARLGTVGDHAISKSDSERHGKTVIYTLCPLSGANWANIRNGLQDEKQGRSTKLQNIDDETNSINDTVQDIKGSKGIVLDAGREVRVKLYMNQVFMGWLWFIPTFHMPHPPPTPITPDPTIKFVLSRKELDFPLGIGNDIIDVEISLEWWRKVDAKVGAVI